MATFIGDQFVAPNNPHPTDHSLDAALRRQARSAWNASQMGGMTPEDAAYFRGKAVGIEQARASLTLAGPALTLVRRPGSVAPLPPQWNCPHCGHGEYQNRPDWEQRAADHIDRCEKRPTQADVPGLI